MGGSGWKLVQVCRWLAFTHVAPGKPHHEKEAKPTWKSYVKGLV